MNFYYYPFIAESGALNMSIDWHLFEISKRNNCANLRFYIWSPPSISFGKNQNPENIVNFKECQKYKIDLVKRPTGGRALLHHKELTYFLSAPLDGKVFPKNFQKNYNLISECLLKGLYYLKIPAEIKKQKSPYKTSPLSSLPCFSEPAPGEIVINDKKIIGSAMFAEEEFFLIHGSIILNFDENIQRKIFINKQKFFISGISDFQRPLPSWEKILKCFKKGFEDILSIKFFKNNFSNDFLIKAKFSSSDYKISKA